MGDGYQEFSISKAIPNIINNKMILYAQVINAWLTGKFTGIPFLRENSTGNPIKLQNVWATNGARRCPETRMQQSDRNLSNEYGEQKGHQYLRINCGIIHEKLKNIIEKRANFDAIRIILIEYIWGSSKYRSHWSLTE